MRNKARIGLVVGLLTALPPMAGAADGTGAAVDRLQEAYRAGSVERMLAVYADDATFEDVNQRHHLTGREQIHALLENIVGMHREMGLEEHRRVVRGDVAVVEYVYKGQLDGAAIGASVGKEGCPDLSYEIPVTSWFRVKDGRIVHQKDYLDWATFLDLRRQMLAAATDGAPAAGPPDSR